MSLNDKPHDPLEYIHIPTYGLLSEIPFEAVTKFRYTATFNQVYEKKEFMRTFFEKAFDTKIKAAFIASAFDAAQKVGDRYTELAVGRGHVILFMDNGRITRFATDEEVSFHCSN